MSLNDELTRIRQAERLLQTEAAGSRLYNAAKDHLFSAAEWAEYPRARAAARAAIARWIERHGDDE